MNSQIIERDGMMRPTGRSMATAYMQRKNLHFVPVIPQRLNFAVLVQRAVHQLDHGPLGMLDQEDLIAVSLPRSVREHVESAIDKFPTVSLVIASVENRVVPQ